MKMTGVLFIIVSLAVWLRLYNLSQLPPSPYWEEVAVAYDAFSIAQTGKDHHGNRFPILALESFGDWKPTGYAYAQIPFQMLFGLSVIALRLPAALAGIACVILVGYLTGMIVQKRSVVLVGMLVAATSPWQIVFSRGGWEVMLATALLGWGLVVLVRSLSENTNKRLLLQFIAGVLLWCSAYTYHAMRVLVPLFLFSIVLIFYSKEVAIRPTCISLIKSLKYLWKTFGMIFAVSLLFFIPFAINLGDQKLSQRYSETSIFSDISIIEESNNAILSSNGALFSRLTYHRYVLFSLEVFSNYIAHFDLGFLFVQGDSNLRHNTGFGGQMYLLDGFLLIIGVLQLFKYTHSSSWRWIVIILLLIVVSPVPASITKATPHALRTLPMSIGLLVTASIGLHASIQHIQNVILKHAYLRNFLRNKKTFLSYTVALTSVAIYLIQPLGWWLHYSKIYAVTAEAEWQYGYEQLVSTIVTVQQRYPDHTTFISRSYGRPAMYYWFYTKTDPQQVQSADGVVTKDQAEYLTYENMHFFRELSQIELDKAIVAVTQQEYETLKHIKDQFVQVETILDSEKKPIWQILLTK